MKRPRVLIITTAYRHVHRFRLHNFLPYLSKHLDLDIIDVAPLGYDMSPKERLAKFIQRVLPEIILRPVKQSKENSFDVITIRSILPGDFGSISALPLVNIIMKKLAYRKYCAILATPFLAGLIALAYKNRFDDTPIAYEDVDRFYDFFRSPSSRLLAKTIEYYTVKHADAVVAASPHLYLEDLSMRGGKKTYFIPNGVEYARFRNAARSVKERDRYTIVYVGAVEWWSGLDIAIRAMSYVIKDLPKAKLYIIGNYKTMYGLQLLRLVKRLGLSEYIVFFGRKPYDFVVNFIPRCRVGLLTFPYSEVTVKSFPYKILEYAASGTPIVMTNVTVLAGLVERYGAGRIHDESDVEGIASSIVELMLNDSLWREHSERAIKLASLFDVERLAKLEALTLASLCI